MRPPRLDPVIRTLYLIPVPSMTFRALVAVTLAAPSAVHAQDSGGAGDVTIEYIAHAAFRITASGGSTVVIDPYASQVWLGYDFPGEVPTDAVLITHPHYDHDAGQYRGLPFPWGNDVRVIRYPGRFTVGDIAVTGIVGKHADPYGKEFGQINTIFLIEVNGLRIAHLGDNGPLTAENVAALGEVDFLMIPIDAEYHILKEDEIHNIISSVAPRFVVPMHYRIAALEASPTGPSDLGEIDPWLEGKRDILRLSEHTHTFSAADLPDVDVIVFPHSPRIPTLLESGQND